MAEGFANTLGRGEVKARSAGISPALTGATSNAVKAMKRFGIDISKHRSKAVTSQMLKDADFIIALDRTVYHVLKNSGVPEEKPLLWHIDDPIGGDVEAYYRCALQIKSRVEEFLKQKGVI